MNYSFPVTGKYAVANVYAKEVEESAMGQLVELCNQPMFANSKIRIMPDVHSGTGCVIGFTATVEKNIIPNLVGVDIGCGVLTTIFKTKDIDFEKLDNFIRNHIPHGCSIRNTPHPNMRVAALIENVAAIVDPDNVQYHLCSPASLGGGNHYIELDDAGNGKVALSVHSGSRNLGVKTCNYFQRKAIDYLKTQKQQLAQLHKTATTPEEHQLIQDKIEHYPKTPEDLCYLSEADTLQYLKCMSLVQAVAADNRRLITEDILSYLKIDQIEQSFDTVHNYVGTLPDGTPIIRKGSIDASAGKYVAIPLNMRDGVIIGIGKGNPDWNYSAPHGAGRLMSRSAAKEKISLGEFEESMKGIKTWSVNSSTLDESPQAYKPADEIIELIEDTIEIKQIVKPIYNFKAS